ncbi:hypothetical protein E3U43_013223 [Larimichthys crocea]|uniref:Uncharacterized protein n=1 Tax=Larimichthys crocea TaxID=215358 RepID=A0ACD3R943_LARCR|nr:hypothetical protein E3U43_013223 [Larimichthys crocea]
MNTQPCSSSGRVCNLQLTVQQLLSVKPAQHTVVSSLTSVVFGGSACQAVSSFLHCSDPSKSFRIIFISPNRWCSVCTKTIRSHEFIYTLKLFSSREFNFIHCHLSTQQVTDP